MNAYAKAREMQAHALVDKALVIARDGRSDFYRDEYGRKKVDYDCVKRCELRVGQYQWPSRLDRRRSP